MQSLLELVLEDVAAEVEQVTGVPEPERRTGDNGLPALSYLLPDANEGPPNVLTVSVRLINQGQPQRIARVYGSDGTEMETSERLRGDATPEVVTAMIESRLRQTLE